MDLDGSKTVCGICKNWGGKREFIDGKARVKSSSKGMCAILKKLKPPHGGCDQWQKWDGTDDAEKLP
jgi:hypothetical protein